MHVSGPSELLFKSRILDDQDSGFPFCAKAQLNSPPLTVNLPIEAWGSAGAKKQSANPDFAISGAGATATEIMTSPFAFGFFASLERINSDFPGASDWDHDEQTSTRLTTTADAK